MENKKGRYENRGTLDGRIRDFQKENNYHTFTHEKNVHGQRKIIENIRKKGCLIKHV